MEFLHVPIKDSYIYFPCVQMPHLTSLSLSVKLFAVA